jgi:GAF domain-containing protein
MKNTITNRLEGSAPVSSDYQATQEATKEVAIESTQQVTNFTHLSALESTGLLDTEKEEVFDRFTALASKILGVPVALISLIDRDRQFFKSQVGLPEPWATKRETPLSHSFCQHVVSRREPLIITNAHRDSLVCDNLAVEELGVVAYAGIPLTTPEGEAIGAFCAIDSQPRKWSEHELEVLRGLAQAVMTEIALRLKTKELERSAERMVSVLENISDAFFHLDKNWCFTYINDQGAQLLSREREGLLGRHVWEEFPQAVGEKFDIEYRRAISSGQHITFEDYF